MAAITTIALTALPEDKAMILVRVISLRPRVSDRLRHAIPLKSAA
ncbi:MAG TPA: hypothetical protein VIO59_03830 [Rhodanobacter sp.]